MKYRELKRKVREQIAKVIWHEADMGGIADVIVGDNEDDRDKVRRAIYEIAHEIANK